MQDDLKNVWRQPAATTPLPHLALLPLARHVRANRGFALHLRREKIHLVESGTHDELYDLKGTYYEIFAASARS